MDPLADTPIQAEELTVDWVTEMIEVDVPITWLESLCKMILMVGMMGIGMLLSIWVGQEGMLYVTDSPIKYIEQNPHRY
jgi:hypothetical protein